MDSEHHTSFRADDRSYYSIIKKDVHRLVTAAGFSDERVGIVDIVISEITSNLHKHAIGGEILVRLAGKSPAAFVEIISIDDGPGIPDTAKVLADGYSSSATLGHGLGSISRLSDDFDIYSLKGWGTILLSRIYEKREQRPSRKNVQFYPLNVPKNGEQLSGDGHCFEFTSTGFRILIADGLGHGKDAHDAVSKACEAFAQCKDTDPVSIIRFIHTEIRKTRGLVGVVIVYNEKEKLFRMAGVGNLSFKWQGGNTHKNYVSYNGIIGHSIPGTINEVTLSQEEFSQFICCSDGIQSRWDLSRFPMIQRHDGMIRAAAIYKEFSRRTDDTSVVVCKTI